MRFLANENVPGSAVDALRQAGHDVAWVRADAPGMPDDRVLEWAMRDARVLLTFDKDFGEFAWRRGLPATCGIILLRISMPDSGTAGAEVARIIGSRSDWTGHFAVIEADRIRMRALPGR